MNNTDIKSIKTAIKRLKAFTDSKPKLPIMNYIRLESRDGKIRLTVPKYDGYGHDVSFTTVRLRRMGTGQDSFAVCVKFPDLCKVVDKCKADIRFTVPDACTLAIESGRLKFKLNGKDTDNFPVLPGVPTDLQATTAITYHDLQSELEFVSHATCDQTPKNYTAGVLFDYSEPKRLTLVGTDGRRLHSTLVTSSAAADHDVIADKPKMLLPVKWVDAFNRLKVASDETVYIKFYTSDRMDWSVPTEGLSGTVSLLDCPYPEYDKVIPDDCQSRFRLNVPGTIEALDGLSVIACAQDGRDMIVVNANGTLELSARSETMGEAVGQVPCDHLEGPDTRFALNVHYFTETLKLAGKDAVIMANSGSLEPVRFDYLETDRIAVVMPVRLPE